MKKILSLLAILAIIFAGSCSKIPENNDPVIGIWSKIEVNNTDQAAKGSVKKEWIFNDAYLGRFHQYNGGELEIITDFKWTRTDEVYTISYPGMENQQDDTVLMNNDELKSTTGILLAKRE